jgi:hypothetical protein
LAAQTIGEVAERLDEVVADCRAHGSRLGYFPALYRRVTLAIRDGIERDRFEDGARMEQLDVVFANLYLDALDRWQRGDWPPAAWRVAFEAADTWPPVVLQHLLLGMNAHINVDLAIAAARTAPGDALPGLRRDFDEINAILAEQTAGVKAELASIWPLLRAYDALAGNLDEGFIQFSLVRARQHAWELAERLAPLDASAQRTVIDEVAGRIALLGHAVWKPPIRTRLILLGVRLGERGTAAEITGRLLG